MKTLATVALALGIGGLSLAALAEDDAPPGATPTTLLAALDVRPPEVKVEQPKLTLEPTPGSSQLGDLVIGRDVFRSYEDRGEELVSNPAYTPYLVSPLARVRGQSHELSLTDFIDYSDATLQAVQTEYVRIVRPGKGLQPYVVAARQSNEYDETIRVGGGAGVRYPVTPDFGVAMDVVSFGTAGNTTTSYARTSETVFMVRVEWGF